MDEQQVSVVLLAINNVKEAVDDMRKSVDDLRMNLKEMRKALNTTTALLKHFGNSEKEVLTEDDDVTSSKVVVVGWNGARSCEPQYCALNSSFKSCLPTVCENDSVRLPSFFVTELTFGGSWWYNQALVAFSICIKPPAKPPDEPLKDFITWISRLHAVVFSINLSSLLISLNPDVLEMAVELELWATLNGFPSYLHFYISYVSDMQWHFTVSHNILFQWNGVQIIWSWFEQYLGLLPDDISYLFLCHGLFTEVGKFVVKFLDVVGFAVVLKSDELITYDFAFKTKGKQRAPYPRASFGLEVYLIALDPVTRHLNLNPICKHVMVYVMWFNGAYEDEPYVQVAMALCSGPLLNQMSTKKIYSEHVVAAMCGFVLNKLHYFRYLIVTHIDLKLENYLVSNKVEDMLHKATDFGEPFFTEDGSILAGCVCYFEVDSTKLDQPIIRLWPEEVRFKGFVKKLFNKEPTELPDIIVIEAVTEGTSPSNSSVQFGIVWMTKTTCKFTLKVHKWAKASLLNDSEAANIYLKQCGWQGYIREQGSASFCCNIGWYLTLQSSSIKWDGSLFHLDLNFLGSQFDALMRCLSHSTSFITSGCCIEPLMLKVNCIGIVGQCLHIRGMVEFMLTLERSVKDGLDFGTHELQFLCLPAHRKDSDFLPHTFFNRMMFLIAYWRTFISWIYTTINLELDKMGFTQVYGKELVVLYSLYIIIISLVGPTNDFMTDDIHFKQLQHTLCILEDSAEKSSYEWRWQMMSLRVNRGVSGGNHPPNSDFNVAVGMARDGAVVTHHGVELELVVSSENNLCGAFSAENGDHIETSSGYRKMFSAICPTSITRARPMQPFPRFSMGIFVCIEVVQIFHLRNYVFKPEPPTEAHDSVTYVRLRTAAGLTHLANKKHELVACKLRESCIELGNNYSEAVEPKNDTTYEGLSVLASVDMTKLNNKVIHNSKFKNFLELVTETGEVINDSYLSHCTSCLEYLGENKLNLLLDINLDDQVKETLSGQIRKDAIIQCAHSFMFVDKRMLANVFRSIIGEMMANVLRSIIGEMKKEPEALVTNKIIFERMTAWHLLASIFTWNLEFLMFSLPRPPEVNDLEDKVVFEGRRM